MSLQKSDLPFWKRKTLAEMNPEEWESLCDGCGRCCLHKLQSEQTGIIYYTNVACRLLDLDTCRCGQYPQRLSLVDDCVALDAESVNDFHWLPSTCAYRLLAEGQDLPQWHPLVSGDPGSVHRAGISVRGTAVREQDVEDLEDHLIDDAL